LRSSSGTFMRNFLSSFERGITSIIGRENHPPQKKLPGRSVFSSRKCATAKTAEYQKHVGHVQRSLNRVRPLGHHPCRSSLPDQLRLYHLFAKGVNQVIGETPKQHENTNIIFYKHLKTIKFVTVRSPSASGVVSMSCLSTAFQRILFARHWVGSPVIGDSE
jgi:hypothetical protein